MNNYYSLISGAIRTFWLRLVSIARMPYCYLLKPDFSIEYFVLDFPFAVSGLQNCVRWKVSGAYSVSINGEAVNPMKGEIVFISVPNHFFLITCSNGRTILERKITVSSYSYQQKKGFSYNRSASEPILLTQKLKGDLFNKIPDDLNFENLKTKSIQKTIQATHTSIGDSQLDRLCSKKVFRSIHDNLKESRLSYDKKFAFVQSEIFKGREVPGDYKKQITTFFKTNYSSKT